MANTKTKLHERAMKAAEKYIEKTGGTIIDKLDDVLVYEDGYDIAFGKVRVTKRTMLDDVVYDYRMSRDEFEEVITKVLYDNPDIADALLRFDMIELFVVHDNRALVRRHINAGFKED